MNAEDLSRVRMPVRRMVLPMLVLGFALGLLFGASGVATSSSAAALPASVPPTPTPLPLTSVAADEQAVLVGLSARFNPSVVNITVFGQREAQVLPLGQGSGFVYDQEGHIVTNAHVVQSARQIEVTFADGTVEAAQVLGEDPNSDLAVIKVDSLPQDVTPISLGDMGELSVGQTAIAIGNPFGLEGTLTRGIISALGRTIPALTRFGIPRAIQTDAAINPGNSGGPLLDLHGHVIGVNAQIETGGTTRSNSGVGFAIPVDIVRLVVPALIEKGEYEWAWLGVRGGSVTPILVEAMDLSVERGAYIVEVTPDGPAERADLRGASDEISVDGRRTTVGGDVVTAIDDRPVRSFEDLLIYIALEAAPGRDVTLTILRDGKWQDVSVRLGTRPLSSGREP